MLLVRKRRVRQKYMKGTQRNERGREKDEIVNRSKVVSYNVSSGMEGKGHI